jgi:uncharacterized protein YjiS (DUF1127 family)
MIASMPTFREGIAARNAAPARLRDRWPLRACRSAVKILRARRSVHVAHARLRSLDDRTLKDIGLHRSEIRSVLMDAAAERRNGVHWAARSRTSGA